MLPGPIEREIRIIEAEYADRGGQWAGPPRLRGLRGAIDVELDRYRTVLREFLHWGPMTSSDRDLFADKFTALVNGTAGATPDPDPAEPSPEPSPETVTVALQVAPVEAEWLVHAAQLASLSVSEYVIRAINGALKRSGVDAVLLRQSDDDVYL